MSLHRDISEAAARAQGRPAEVRVGNVTRISSSGTLALVTVNGREMWAVPETLAIGDRVAYWDGRTPVVIGTLAAASTFEYPYHSGTVVEILAGEDVQAAIDGSGPGDELILEAGADFADDLVVWDLPHRLYLHGADGTWPSVPRIGWSLAMEGLWLSGMQVKRTTPVDSNSYEGIQSDGGILSRSRFFDLEITGHGLSIGIELNRRYRNVRNVIHNVRVHEIENRGFWLNCDHLRTWGLEAHNLYRTVDQSFFDVDAVNWAGVGQVHSGFWFRGITEADSISTDNGGSASPPHPDGWQCYATELLDTTQWLSSATFEDGVVDLRSGGRQAFILESNDSAGAHLVSDVTIRRCKMAGTDFQVVNCKGVDGLVIEDSDIWITELSSVTARGVRYTSGASGGATTNPNSQLIGNRLYAADGQPLRAGTIPGDLFENGNVDAGTTVEDPTGWLAPVVQRPTDDEVEAWLTAA